MNPPPPDAALIARLHDIVEPAAVGGWPWAPGWWLLAALLLLCALRVAHYALSRWRRTAYRREARRELRRLASADFATPAERVSACLTLLRRCLLALRPRAEVAVLSGARWADELLACWPAATTLREDLRLLQLLSEGAYLPPDRISAGDAERLHTFTQGWVDGHRA